MIKGSGFRYIQWLISMLLILLLYLCHLCLTNNKSDNWLIKVVGNKVVSEKYKCGTYKEDINLYENVRQELRLAGLENVDPKVFFNVKKGNCSKDLTKSIFNTLTVMNAMPLEIVQKDSIIHLKALVLFKQNWNISFKFRETNDSLVLLEVKGLYPIIERLKCYEEFKKEAFHAAQKK